MSAGPWKKKNRRSQTAATEIESEIGATNREIDELVYELYDISDHERKIIEGGL